MTHPEMIAVLKAAAAGEGIEVRNLALSGKAPDGWSEVRTPAWDFSRYEYRVSERKHQVVLDLGEFTRKEWEDFRSQVLNMHPRLPRQVEAAIKGKVL